MKKILKFFFPEIALEYSVRVRSLSNDVFIHCVQGTQDLNTNLTRPYLLPPICPAGPLHKHSMKLFKLQRTLIFESFIIG